LTPGCGIGGENAELASELPLGEAGTGLRTGGTATGAGPLAAPPAIGATPTMVPLSLLAIPPGPPGVAPPGTFARGGPPAGAAAGGAPIGAGTAGAGAGATA